MQNLVFSLNFRVEQSPGKMRLRLSASKAWIRNGAPTQRSPKGFLGGILVVTKGGEVGLASLNEIV
jgi:hypothetical protein